MVFCKISENSWDGGEFLLLVVSGSLVPSLHLKNWWFNGPVSNYIDLWQLALFLHFHSLNIARNFGKQRKGWHYSNTNNFQSNMRCYCCEKSSASLTSEIHTHPPAPALQLGYFIPLPCPCFLASVSLPLLHASTSLLSLYVTLGNSRSVSLS